VPNSAPKLIDLLSSSELIASGDADAIAIFEEYGKVAMTDFYFEDADMEALLVYLENPPVEVKAATAVEGAVIDEGMKGSTKLMIVTLILLTLVFVLTSVKNSLKEKKILKKINLNLKKLKTKLEYQVAIRLVNYKRS